MNAKEFIARMEAVGWYEDRRVSSHRIFKHSDYPHNISVPDHGKKDLKPGILNKLMKQAGLK